MPAPTYSAATPAAAGDIRPLAPDELFSRLRSGRSDSMADAAATGSTAAFLSSCLLDPATLRSPASAEVLHRLCDKVDVTRRVHAGYDPHWRKPAGTELLPLTWWPVLVAALLYHGSRLAFNSAGKGPALKFINAAYNATDQFRSLRGNAATVATLFAAIDHLMDSVVEL